MKPKRQFDWIKYVFKICLNQSEKSSIADIRLGSKYASASITLNLTIVIRNRKTFRFLWLWFNISSNKNVLAKEK